MTQVEFPLNFLTIVPLPYKLQWHTFLASGARVFGNIEHSVYFQQNAKSYAKELFDETDGVTASALSVLGFHFAGIPFSFYIKSKDWRNWKKQIIIF